MANPDGRAIVGRRFSIGTLDPSEAVVALVVVALVAGGAQLYLTRAERDLERAWKSTLTVGARASAARLASWRDEQLEETQLLARLVQDGEVQSDRQLELVSPTPGTGRSPAAGFRIEASTAESATAVFTAPVPNGRILERRVPLGASFWRLLPRVPIDPSDRPYRTGTAEAVFQLGKELVEIGAKPDGPPGALTIRSVPRDRAETAVRMLLDRIGHDVSVAMDQEAIRVVAAEDSNVAATMTIGRSEAFRDLIGMRWTVWGLAVVTLLGLAVLLGAIRGARKAESERRKTEALLVSAELHALRGQLQPHFLFNTLNTVAGLVESDPAATRKVVEALSELLRASLDLDTEPEITVAHELELLGPYLEIQTIRFGHRLQLTTEVSPDARDVLMPRLLLQPLVENAIRHGVGPRARGGSVRIEIADEGAQLIIGIEDDGVGLGPGSLREGVGLGNSRARLATLYRSAASLRLAPGSNGGARVEVRLPSRRSAESPQSRIEAGARSR